MVDAEEEDNEEQGNDEQDGEPDYQEITFTFEAFEMVRTLHTNKCSRHMSHTASPEICARRNYQNASHLFVQA